MLHLLRWCMTMIGCWKPAVCRGMSDRVLSGPHSSAGRHQAYRMEDKAAIVSHELQRSGDIQPGWRSLPGACSGRNSCLHRCTLLGIYCAIIVLCICMRQKLLTGF